MRQCAVLVAFLGLWGVVAMSGLFLPSLFPGPLVTAQALGELFASGALLEHSIASLRRVGFGFLLAAVTAVPLGLLLGWYTTALQAFSPLISILRTVSPLAWVPLAILWFGIGETPAIFVIFMASFFPVLIATASAPQKLDPLLLKVAANYELRRSDFFLRVLLPASLPYIVVGMRIALGFAWVVIVAAEMVGMRSGLGYLILDARNSLRTDLILAGMIAIGLIGVALDAIFSRIELSVRRTFLGES